MSRANQQDINCAKCQRLPTEWPCSKRYEFKHHESFKALDQSAADGCPLCRIARQVLIYGAEKDKLLATSCPIEVQVSGPSEISFGLGSGDILSSSFVSAYGLLEVKEDTVSAGKSLAYGSKVKRFRPTDQVLELEDVMASCIRPWVSNCCKNSQIAQATPAARLPTRVIDVGGGHEDARLLDTSGQHGTYLILSYCWGKGNDKAKTTQHNLEERRRAIAKQDLPATIKQAIEVTKMLGFRYLWVDAICIVQAHSVPPKYDELEDWRREAPNMGRYYRNAVLTIAATAATDSEHGFISERSSQTYPVSPSPLGVWIGEFEPYSKAVIIPGAPSASNQVHYAPLYSRGWTLQERALSHHTLHWCSESVYWECKGCIKASEFEPNIQYSLVPGAPGSRHLWETALRESKDTPAYYEEPWLDLIEDYCQMSLSYETDRLMAIQGLVDETKPSNRRDNEYIAGVFKLGIVTSLAWSNPTPRVEKQSKFPSWSWASLAPGDLYFHHLAGRFAAVKSVNYFDITGRDHRADGRLQLTAPLREIHTNLIKNENDSRCAILDKAYPFNVDFQFDAVGCVPPFTGVVTLLALGWTVEWKASKQPGEQRETTQKTRRVVGLVLWPTGGQVTEYKRIGIFNVLERVECMYWETVLKQNVYIT